MDEARLQLIASITEDINAGKTLEDVLTAVYEKLRGLVPYNRIGVALIDGHHDRIRMVALRTDGAAALPVGYAGKLSGSTLETILKTGQPRIINDLEEYLRAKPESESTRLMVREGMRSSLTLPLVVRGRPVGVMFFSSRRANSYDDHHVAFLKLISGHVAIAVEKSLLLQELRDKTDHLESILRNSADAIVIIDKDDIIRSWNRGAQQIFGYTEEEIVGRHKSVLLPELEVRSGEVEKFRQILERDGYVAGYEAVGVTKSGRKISLSVTSTAIRDGKGQITGRCSILRDITRLKELQDHVVRVQSLAVVGELAASVAHEIRNPLAAISGAVQILHRSFPEGDERRRVAQELVEQVRRLDETVRDLLIFARPWKPQPRELDLVSFITGILHRPEMVKATAGLYVVTDLPRKCLVEADAQLLEHVLTNILQNAIDASSKGGKLSLRLRENGSYVEIEVEDTGTGIAPEHREKLFKPFFSTKSKGTGLGLAISKKVVDSHRGTISISSELGKGTVVRIALPRTFKEV